MGKLHHRGSQLNAFSKAVLRTLVLEGHSAFQLFRQEFGHTHKPSKYLVTLDKGMRHIPVQTLSCLPLQELEASVVMQLSLIHI